MTTKDVLALALEALEEHDGNYAQSNASAARVNAAITAIKQAQAQQFMGFDVVLDPTMAPDEMKLVQAQQAQEPVESRSLTLAKQQWEHWKQYALELQERLVKYEGGAPMVLNATEQAPKQEK